MVVKVITSGENNGSNKLSAQLAVDALSRTETGDRQQNNSVVPEFVNLFNQINQQILASNPELAKDLPSVEDAIRRLLEEAKIQNPQEIDAKTQSLIDEMKRVKNEGGAPSEEIENLAGKPKGGFSVSRFAAATLGMPMDPEALGLGGWGKAAVIAMAVYKQVSNPSIQNLAFAFINHKLMDKAAETGNPLLPILASLAEHKLGIGPGAIAAVAPQAAGLGN